MTKDNREATAVIVHLYRQPSVVCVYPQWLCHTALVRSRQGWKQLELAQF